MLLHHTAIVYQIPGEGLGLSPIITTTTGFSILFIMKYVSRIRRYQVLDMFGHRKLIQRCFGQFKFSGVSKLSIMAILLVYSPNTVMKDNYCKKHAGEQLNWINSQCIIKGIKSIQFHRTNYTVKLGSPIQITTKILVTSLSCSGISSKAVSVSVCLDIVL